jgi:acyl-CoA thioester hydrolase
MNAAYASPSSGLLNGRTHVFPVRVYFEDTDAGGIVYHASYLRFAERGRTEMLRAVGIELAQLRDDDGLIFVVRKGDMQYHKTASLDDCLAVKTSLAGIRGASVLLQQTIFRIVEEEVSEKLFDFNVHVACMGQDGKAARLPSTLRGAFEKLL